MKPEEVKNWRDEWKEVSFHDSIKVVGIERGRSAAHFSALSEDGKRQYSIFMTDFLDMAEHCEGLVISGEFCVMKRGRNLGIRLKATKKRTRPNWFEISPEGPIPAFI